MSARMNLAFLLDSGVDSVLGFGTPPRSLALRRPEGAAPKWKFPAWDISVNIGGQTSLDGLPRIDGYRDIRRRLASRPFAGRPFTFASFAEPPDAMLGDCGG